jgi:phosphatidylserine/phosphatidylglycerophosphate/cardiolipin synthase-like enzyme
MHSRFITELKGYLTEQREQGNSLILKAEVSWGAVFRPKVMGAEIIPASIEAIKRAEEEVLIMGYKLNKGCEPTDDLRKALKSLNDKRKESDKKIRVRILINAVTGLGSHWGPSSLPERFEDIEFSNLDFQYIEHQHSMFGSYHTKYIIVDGNEAFLSSGDFAKDKNYKTGIGCIDIGTHLMGNIVKTIRDDFAHAWTSSSKQDFIPENLNEANQPFNSASQISNSEVSLVANDVAMLHISKKANGYFFNRRYLSPTILALVFAIKNAKSAINIMTPNFNIPEVIEALADANARGVTINIIMSPHMNESREDTAFMGGSNLYGVKKLFSTIRQCENNDLSKLHVRWSVNNDTGKIVKSSDTKNEPFVIHAKLACIDDVVIAGSSVLDLQSAYYSRESDICIDSHEVTQTYLKEIFFPFFDRGAEVYFDQEGKLIFTVQEVLEKVAEINESFIALLEHKKQSCNAAVGNIEKSTIENILGNSDDNDGTLYEMKGKTAALLERNSQQITSEEIDNLMDCYQKIVQKIHDAHLAENDFVKTQSVFYKIKTFFSDIVRKFLNLKDDLEFAKNLTTHSLMNHLNEELTKNEQYLQGISPNRR